MPCIDQFAKDDITVIRRIGIELDSRYDSHLIQSNLNQILNNDVGCFVRYGYLM